MKKIICRLEDIPKLGARRYQGDDGRTIAIFRTESDKVFALRDSCPHKGGPLSQGIVFGESVACPLHNWCISLETGTAAAPDEGTVERFNVKVVGGEVELEVTPARHSGPPTRHSGPPTRHPGPPTRHPGEGRDPINWAPACAGETNRCAGDTKC
jgi:nitrite reductase (NADH) small subunit